MQFDNSAPARGGGRMFSLSSVLNGVHVFIRGLSYVTTSHVASSINSSYVALHNLIQGPVPIRGPRAVDHLNRAI